MYGSSLRKSPSAVAILREKLFLLWGDLEEQKGHSSNILEWIDGNAQSIRKKATKSMAFECCLKEYGVKTLIQRPGVLERSESEDDETVERKDIHVWERRWRMFGTTII